MYLKLNKKVNIMTSIAESDSIEAANGYYDILKTPPCTSTVVSTDGNETPMCFSPIR